MNGASAALLLLGLFGGSTPPSEPDRAERLAGDVHRVADAYAPEDDEAARYLRPVTYRPRYEDAVAARAVPEPTTESTEIEKLPPRSKMVPALGLGASVGVGLLGAVFAVKAMDALGRSPPTRAVVLTSGASVTIPDPESLRVQGQEALTNGLLSLLCASGAIAGLVTSTLLLLSE